MDKANDRFGRLKRYWKWCAGTIFVWFFVYRSCSDYPVANIAINTIMLILVLPVFLDTWARMALVSKNYKLMNSLAMPAVFIGECMNVIPGNPFALGLPDALNLRSLALLNLEKPKEAEKTLRRLKAVYEEIDDLNPFCLAQVGMLLSNALSQQGKYEESQKASKEAIAVLESQPPDKFFNVASALTDLCTTLSKTGQIKQALEAGHRALELKEKLQDGSDHQLIMLGMAMNNLAIAYDYASNFVKGQELYQKSLDIKLRIFGDNSKEAVLGYNNVGYALLEQGQYDKAAEFLEKAKNTAVKLNLQNGRIWKNVLCNCGDAHRGQGRLEEAEAEQLEVLQLREKAKDEELHESYHCLGKLYRDKNDFSKSESYFDKALRIREKRFGNDHPKVGRTLEEYAQLLNKMNRAMEAQSMEERAKAIREKNSIIAAN